MIKKIIFLFSITYFFILQSSPEPKEKNNLYRKWLDNRLFGFPGSAIIGGGLGAGLTYLSHKNRFLSSLNVTVKIRNASYWKSIGFGTLAGIGLYELLKRFMKSKKKTDDQKNKHKFQGKLKVINDELIADNEKIKVFYYCPDSLFSLLFSVKGLDTDTAENIERIISQSKIKQYTKNQFWFCATAEESRTIQHTSQSYNANYAAALYLLNEDQKDEFKDKFTPGCSINDLYKINKPTAKENLFCYALPLQRYEKRTISEEITKENIDSYSFKLTEPDRAKIDLNAKEIVGICCKSRNNSEEKQKEN